MIEDLVEYNSESGMKESVHIHPTLKMVQKKMKGFDEALIMYVYHKMNGREQDAQSYLEEWEEEQDGIRNELIRQAKLATEQLAIEEQSDSTFKKG
jgi:hypothetical protein